MKGAFRGALRLAMDEAIAGNEAHDEPRQDRAWKLFMLLPRMLLQRPGRGGVVPKKKIQERLTAFAAGQWAELVRESMVSAEQGSEAMRVKRAAREKLVHQALEGAEVAPGTLRTLAALTDPHKRPTLPREPVPEDIDAFVPTSLFDLIETGFAVT